MRIPRKVHTRHAHRRFAGGYHFKTQAVQLELLPRDLVALGEYSVRCSFLFLVLILYDLRTGIHMWADPVWTRLLVAMRGYPRHPPFAAEHFLRCKQMNPQN